MMERDAHDPKQPPKLKSLDLRELGAVGGALDVAVDGLVCDIDDPDCEVPSGSASRPLEGITRDERRTEVAPADD